MRSPIFQHAADMYREMRREFDVVLEAAYAAAEEGTHGSLLNALGRREPVTAFSLLTGPWSRVEKYGSPELIEWFNQVGRPSVLDFEREWLHARWEMPWPLLTDDEPEPEPEPRIVLQFPNDPDLTDEMRAEVAARFSQAQGLYPVEWRR